MHIPDGYLDPTVSVATYIIFLAYFVYAFKFMRKGFSSEKATLLSVLASGIFVAQMLNWPIPGGTSLHFVGGALAGILLGPWLGFLTIFLVLLVQCLIFHDGGITALGANSINMAIVDVLVGYLIYYVIVKYFGRRGSVIGAFLGGWAGITLAGLACGLEIGFSPSFPYGVSVTVPVMTLWHLGLGIVEGAITASIVAYLARRMPELLYSGVRV